MIYINTKGNPYLISALCKLLYGAGFKWSAGDSLITAPFTFSDRYMVACINLEHKEVTRDAIKNVNTRDLISLEQLIDILYVKTTPAPKLGNCVMDCKEDGILSQVVKTILHEAKFTWVSGNSLIEDNFYKGEGLLVINDSTVGRTRTAEGRTVITTDELCTLLANKPKIIFCGRAVERNENSITIGCKTFSKEEVLDTLKFMEKYQVSSANFYGQYVIKEDIIKLIKDLIW